MKAKEVLQKTRSMKLVIMTDKGEGLFCDTRLSFYNEVYTKLRKQVESMKVVGFSIGYMDVLYILVGEI